MTQTIGEILPEAARRFGTKTALRVEKRAFTFLGQRGISPHLFPAGEPGLHYEARD